MNRVVRFTSVIEGKGVSFHIQREYDSIRETSLPGRKQEMKPSAVVFFGTALPADSRPVFTGGFPSAEILFHSRRHGWSPVGADSFFCIGPHSGSRA